MANYGIGGRFPGFLAAPEGPVPVWNAATLTIIGIEVLIIAGLIGLTLLMQSKKTDFI